MKKLLQSLFLLLFVAVQAMAQVTSERTVTGTVTAKDDGLPIPGATVKIKGTAIGTQTNGEGKFSLKVSNSSVLVFTYIGYAAKEVSVGSANTLSVMLLPDAKQLGEVVVTAMGQSRQAKSLGYANSTVKSAEITAANNVNAMSGIQGKVAGVSISNSGSTGGSTKVIIRGVSSFSGGNQPLYVIDGVPINNSTKGDNATNRSVDLGNQANDINPDDIESMSILKGASATALYGSRAAHGVVMITTKSGKANQKLKITYSGALNFSNVLRTPQTQNVFGQGWPNFAYEENGSWGPKLNGQIRDWGTLVDGVRLKKPFAYVENNVRNFYNTGTDNTNSISISGGGEHSSFVFSYSNTGQKGITPSENGDKFSRNNFSFRGNSKYGRFETNYNVSYVRKDMNAIFAGQGTSDGGKTLYQELIQTPVDINLTSLKDYKNKYNNADNFYTLYAANPYFVANENAAILQDDRFYGKLDISYGLTNHIKAIGRLGGDFSNTTVKDQGAVMAYTPGSFSAVNKRAPIVGRYGENYRKDNQLDATFLLQGDQKLTEDINLNATLGGNYNQRGFNSLDAYISGLNVPGWYSLKNTSTAPINKSVQNRRRLFGAFGEFNFDFRDYLFLNASVRNDWSSTLPAGLNSYFYYGLNSSVVLTEMLPELKSDKLEYLKVRAAWGKTGADADPYLVFNNYQPTEIPLGFGNVFLPINGVAGLTHNKLLGNNTLRPEMTTELEFGLESRWFNNRVGVDFSFYDRKTKDQIIAASLAPESGYFSKTLNIGNIQNRGVEAALNLTPVKSGSFSWDLNTTFTKNMSKVLSLYGNAKELTISSIYSVSYVAEVGKPLGIFKVPVAEYVKSGPDAGKMIVSANGLPKIDLTTKKEVGQSGADFEMGFTNKFSYKNWSLSSLIDWRKGGKFYSYTAQANNFVGSSTETTFNERQPFLVPNTVKEVSTAGVISYVENNIPISSANIYNYWNPTANTTMFEHTILDRDYLKLREVVLTYSLPNTLVSKLHLSKVDVSFVGRNLFMYTPASNNFVDPEATNYGNDITSNVGEFAAGPTLRTLGGSLKVTF